MTSSFSRPRYDGPSVAPAAPNLDSVEDLSGRSRTGNHAPMAYTVPRTMEMPPAQRSLLPRDPRPSSLPRRQPRCFVRSAAVMCAPPYVPHMYADPPTPPPVGSAGTAGDSDGYDDGDEDGDDERNDYTDGEGAPGDDFVAVGGTSGDVHSCVEAASSTAGCSGASLGNAVGADDFQVAPGPMLSRGAVAMQGRSYPLFSGTSLQPSPSFLRNAVTTAAVAGGASKAGGSGVSSRHAAMNAGQTGLASGAGAGPAAASGLAGTGGGLSSPSHFRKRAASERDIDDGSPADAPTVRGVGNPADTLAELLAARCRNLRLFPAACWVPGAEAVLTAAQGAQVQAGQPSHARARSPQAGSVTPRGPPAAGVNMASSPRRVGVRTSQPPSPIIPPTPQSQGQVPPPSLPADESSDDMNDDDLVLAYVTPPASPSLAPRGSPRSARPLSGKRRRTSSSRVVRGETAAAAGAAIGAAVHRAEDEPASLSSRDVYDAVRAGFSSINRELTRYRVELVVVKSQSASVLRQMDGISAAVDGSESGNGALMERVAGLEKVISALAERLPTAGDGSAERGASGEMPPSLINDIKVRFLGV